MCSQPRFIADVMLGRLAKWLRILGFDTLYFNNIGDNEVIKIAKQEQRILLTGDTRLVRSKKTCNYILIKSTEITEQLNEVLPVSTLKSLNPLISKSRCVKCNGDLKIIERESVSDDLPEHIFLSFNSFFRCSNCGKVYWEGSHKKMIDAKIKDMFKGWEFLCSSSQR